MPTAITKAYDQEGPQQPLKRLFTADQLRHQTANNSNVLIVYDGKVYDVTRFLKHHGGGQMAMLHQNGKDSTDVIDAFHPKMDARKRLQMYYVGEFIDTAAVVAGEDQDLINRDEETDSGISSLSVTTEEELDGRSISSGVSGGLLRSRERSVLTRNYLELHRKIKELGLYQPSISFYVRRVALFAVVLLSAIYLAVQHPSEKPYLAVSAVMIALVWHGLSFTVHDAGHHSVTGNRRTDDLVGCVLASFVGGLSVQWWQVNHNIHHIVTNDPEHDPDIQHLPLFAVSQRFFDDLYSTFHRRIMKFDMFARAAVSVQHFLYYPVMTFGRFNLYAQSLNHLLNFQHPDGKKYRWLELCGIVFFWTWFGYGVLGCVVQGFWNKVMFLYISHAATFILHVQITLSHFAMDTECNDENETFAVKAVRTTMNVDCPEWQDWIHGGLQFQIEHHMFPRVPRCNFRKLVPLVRQFCTENGLKYHSDNFLVSNMIVINSLRQVAMKVKTFLQPAIIVKGFTSDKQD